MSWPNDAETLDLRPWIENWWRRTGNPLYAWEAISRSLNGGESPPEWAMAYLKDAAEKMRLLAMGMDFRAPDVEKISARKAATLVAEALGLWAAKKKSAFSRRADDGEAAAAALDDEYSGRKRARDLLNRVQADRAGRVIAKGKKLNHPAR